MAQGKQAIKARIRSIQSTKKITSAMELIANAKLQKQRNLVMKNKAYAQVLTQTVQDILANNPEIDNAFLKPKKSIKVLTIVFFSDLGLCGGYNVNTLKLLKEKVPTDSLLVVIGTHHYGTLKKLGYTIVNEMTSGDDIDFTDIRKLSDKAIDLFLQDEIGKVQILYTEYINTLSFEPKVKTLIPVEAKQDEKAQGSALTEFEPSPDEILNELVPMMIRSSVYSLWLETKTSEQASRRMAMESATDNAEELVEKLILEFNQARQAAITQEITEIVSGADAL